MKHISELDIEKTVDALVRER